MKILQHYTGVIRHWLWIILIGTVICSIATFGISKYGIKPTYQAISLMQVNGPLTSSDTSTSSDVFDAQALAVGYSVLITSTDVLRRVAQKFPGIGLSQLQSTVNAAPQAGSQIIEVQAQAGSPQQAADIANTVVSVFIQLQVKKAMAPLTDQDTKISQDLLTTKTAMDQAQTQLIELQKSGASTDALAAEDNILATYQAKYSSLLTSQQQIQMQENRAKNALSVAQTAIAPNQINSPHIVQNTVIAAVLGLLLMLTLALLLDWLDVSIQTPEDITNLTQLEPLGSVPLSRSPLLLTNEAKPSEAGDETIEQASILMAISTNFSMLNKGQHVVLMTGLRTDAGVTTISTNLAIALAHLGKRVLLVDTNLRQPSLHEIFHCSNAKGLVDSLTDVHDFSSGMIQSWLNFWRTNIPNLWLLPVGSASAYSPMVQRLQEMQMLTEHLLGKTPNMSDMASSRTVDIIIFDAPVLSEGVDAIALASIADCTILVVEAGKERNEMVSKAGAVFQRLGSPVLGVVVNRQTAKHRPYFYTDERPQKTALASNLSLEEAIEALLTKRTAQANTSLLLPEANQQHGVAGQSQPLANGSTHNPRDTILPSTYTPRLQNQQEATNPVIPVLNRYSGENTR